MKIMFLGTSSNAGKTLLTASLCRYMSKKGYDVVPFKGSNLSLNSYVTADGKEIGMGQTFQAWASSKEPVADMNPILLKPSGKGVIQTVVEGKPYGNISPGCFPDIDELRTVASDSFNRLTSSHEAVICEGSGSPVELNLMDRDIANMNMVVKEKIPSIIVGDIERGGVFAAIYGTWKLINEEDRKYIQGFIINRFRGEPSLLNTGIAKIEELTGMKCIGVVPYVNLKFPEEDSMSSKKGLIKGNDMRTAYIDNLDEFIDSAKQFLDFEELIRISSKIIA